MVEWYWILIAIAIVAVGLSLLWAGDSTDAEEARLYKRQYEEVRAWIYATEVNDETWGAMLERHKREQADAGL